MGQCLGRARDGQHQPAATGQRRGQPRQHHEPDPVFGERHGGGEDGDGRAVPADPRFPVDQHGQGDGAEPSDRDDLCTDQAGRRRSRRPAGDAGEHDEPGRPDQGDVVGRVHPVEAQQPGRPRAGRVDSEHPGDDQPQRLRRARQAAPGDHDGSDSERRGDSQQHQRARADRQVTPGDRHEDRGGDQHAQRPESEQDGGHRERRSAWFGQRQRRQGRQRHGGVRTGVPGHGCGRRWRSRCSTGCCGGRRLPQLGDQGVGLLQHLPEPHRRRPLDQQPARGAARRPREQRLATTRAAARVEVAGAHTWHCAPPSVPFRPIVAASR